MDWIPVKKELPPWKQSVLLAVLLDASSVLDVVIGHAILYLDRPRWIRDNGTYIQADLVKGWCPLPGPLEASDVSEQQESVVHYLYYSGCYTDPNRDELHFQTVRWSEVTCPECLKRVPDHADPSEAKQKEPVVHYHYMSEWGMAADYFACNTDPNIGGPHVRIFRWDKVTCPECLKRAPQDHTAPSESFSSEYPLSSKYPAPSLDNPNWPFIDAVSPVGEVVNDQGRYFLLLSKLEEIVGTFLGVEVSGPRDHTLHGKSLVPVVYIPEVTKWNEEKHLADTLEEQQKFVRLVRDAQPQVRRSDDGGNYTINAWNALMHPDKGEKDWPCNDQRCPARRGMRAEALGWVDKTPIEHKDLIDNFCDRHRQMVDAYLDEHPNAWPPKEEG